MLRVVFLGTPAFAVPTLEALLASRHTVLSAVTQPDRPSGRGHRVLPSPVKALATTAGLPVWQPDRMKDSAWLDTFRALRADIGVVAAYGKILPQVLLDIPPRGFVNVHASLLPRYRGASPIAHAVMNGDHATGVTIMRVVLALDAGPMLASASLPIGPDDTAGDVEGPLARLGASLLVEVLDAIDSGTARETPQDDRLATYAPRLTKADGIIAWTLPAPALHDRVRGLQPWPGAASVLNGSRLALFKGRSIANPSQCAEPGTILEAHAERLVVAAGHDTAYQILEVQPEGRRRMSSRDFLAGHRVVAGDRFQAS